MHTAHSLTVCQRGGLLARGVSLPGGLPAGGSPCQRPPSPLWTEFLTHAYENIPLPQTTFAGSKNLNKLFCATGYWLPCSLFKFFLKFLDQRYWRFSEGYLNSFSTELSSQICDCFPRNFLIQEGRIGNVVSTSQWIRPVER